MKKSTILIITGISTVITAIFLFFVEESYFNLLIGLFGLISVALGFYWQNENEKTAQLNLEENRLQHVQIMDAVKKAGQKINNSSSKNKEEVSNIKLQQLMTKISINLQKEHFSKEDLLQKINKPLYCLLFHKTEEASLNDNKAKTLRDKILPELGFKFIRGSRGIYILPPSLLPDFANREEIERWVKRKILNRIPSNYRYIFSFISLIDLRFTLSIKEDKLTKKYDTLLETIGAEELIGFSQGLNYLHTKKNLSIKDIIEIPNFFFLIEGTSLDISKKQILKEKNEEIIKIIQKDFKKEIFTKDIPNMDSSYLFDILKKYVILELKDIEQIKSNASFWEDVINNHLFKLSYK